MLIRPWEMMTQVGIQRVYSSQRKDSGCGREMQQGLGDFREMSGDDGALAGSMVRLAAETA